MFTIVARATLLKLMLRFYNHARMFTARATYHKSDMTVFVLSVEITAVFSEP